MEDLSCTDRPFYKIPGEIFTLPSFIPEPIDGYEVPTDFPYCCDHHRDVIDNAQTWFDKFPYCCKPHTELAEKRQIDKNDFQGLPRKIVDCLAFTEYHIKQRISIPEWYQDITDYIDYIVWSFGHPNIGLHKYSQFLIQFLTHTKAEIPQSKRQRLIEYVKDYHKPKKNATKFDLNVIYDIFQKWIKTFPFDLPYFNGLKEQFERKIPAFSEPAKYNPYLGTAKAKGITQPELIVFLDALTKRLISEVQTHDFQISDMKQHRLKLENESLRVGTDELVKGYSKGELKYVTTIKKWLELQKQYFKAVVEITRDAKTAEKSKPKSNEELPTLENALVSPERLRPLFVWLKKKQGNKEWFDDSGYIGSDERNASILLGFADGMKMARQMKPHLSEKQLYHILCRHYNLKPTPEPHKVRKGYNFKEVKKLVMEFFRLE